MSQKFVNIAKLREQIRKYAERKAREAGLQNPHAYVRVGDPKNKGDRPVEVEVTYDSKAPDDQTTAN